MSQLVLVTRLKPGKEDHKYNSNNFNSCALYNFFWKIKLRVLDGGNLVLTVISYDAIKWSDR